MEESGTHCTVVIAILCSVTTEVLAGDRSLIEALGGRLLARNAKLDTKKLHIENFEKPL